MNVIVSNLNGNKFSNLDIDVIKSITVEFTVDEIIQSFSNFFFNRMFLDVTAIQNYFDVNNLKKLSVGLDVSKIILLLSNDSVVQSDSYISSLISIGIYNFANTEDELKYLYYNPNSYRDVAHLQKINEVIPTNKEVVSSGIQILGFKNFTSHAGATSFIYMLKKQLEDNYKTLAIEVDKNDFMYFNDQDMRSVTTSELDSIIKNPNNTYDIILVDINESPKVASISEVLHLIEPSTIKLNKLIRTDRMVLTKMKNYKLILNKCLLSDKDVKDFEYESRCKVFETIPPLDDKKEKNPILNNLLYKMGFDKQTPTSGAKKPVGKLFGIVKDE